MDAINKTIVFTWYMLYMTKFVELQKSLKSKGKMLVLHAQTLTRNCRLLRTLQVKVNRA